MLNWVRPSLLISLILVLVISQLCYALIPYRRRAYLPVLLLALLGVALGQVWDAGGLPSLRLGEANLLPAALFAVALQPLARYVPIRLR
jgi:hypothetical protein